MKKKKILTILAIIILVFCVFMGFKNLFSYIFTNKYRIKVKSSDTFYAGSNIEMLVSLESDDYKSSKNINYKFELFDSDDKKVKNVKYSCKADGNNQEEVSIELPEDLEKGNYNLRIKAGKGLYSSEADYPITINPSIQNDVIISLDKGIYKPGDEINYRALIISKRDSKPISSDVSVYIYDGNDNKVYLEKVKTSDFGILSGSFKLADEVNSGAYKICVDINGQEVSKVFNVNPYITPKYEVSILTDKDDYLVNDEAEITVACKYFFGEPVARATVTGTINNEEVKGFTDVNGNFVYKYKMDKAGTFYTNFTVTDSSNYMIEAEKTISCGTDVFEIEILPEYGDIADKVSNDVYVFTKTASGNPVKTYSQVSIGNLTKQLISDENGIGKVTFTSSEISQLSSYSSVDITVYAKDMNEQTVRKSKSFKCINDINLIKTDKVKYEKGEDIEIELVSKIDDNNSSAFIYKGRELIKTVTFDGNKTKVNLDGLTGIIDIYVPKSKNNNYYSYSYYDYNYEYDDYYDSYSRSNYSKKTIFIKPDQALNIEVNLEKDEYEPGDTLKAKFTTTNESNQSVESALLVSILDEAILSLQDNDLSIDNIKIALEDIELSDGITAADLYASVIGKESETLLMSVLLRQSRKDPNIVNRSFYNYDSEIEMFKAIIYLLVSAIIIFILCINKFEKFRKFVLNSVVPVINVLGIFILILILFEMTDLYYDIYRALDYNSILILLSVLVVSIVLYVLVLYKFRDDIFKTIYQIFIPLIIFPIGAIIYSIFKYSYPIVIYVLILALLMLFTIITAMKRKGKLKSRFLIILDYLLIMMIKFGAFAFLFYILSEEIIDSEAISLIICLTLFIFLNKMIEKKKKPDEFLKDNKIVINVTTLEIIGMLIGLILIVMVGLYIYNSAQSTITDSLSSMSVDEEMVMPRSDYGDVMSQMKNSMGTVMPADTSASDTTGTASGDQSIFGFKSFSSTVNSSKNEDINYSDENGFRENSETGFSEKATKVRNIFLESMAFIPELITSNGTADLNVPISDNITTWSIQTVGNTKDGNIGYANAQFKVFKDYFIDFSLPTNSVVSDKVSIPVTIYNYTEENLQVDLNVVENNWSTIGNYQRAIDVSAKGTQMIYIPIEITKEGINTLRIESKANGRADIVEKNLTVKINGLEVEKNISSGIITENYSMDILFDENYIPGTEKMKVRVFPSPMIQAIDNIEAMLRLPTGCFEQTSSSLYPDILVLKYLKSNNSDNEAIRTKALDYISKGYQKLLTYEVPGQKGGYSLYGDAPAEPVITAFGLMEFNELKDVYEIDEKVINNMIDYLFSVQNMDGTFDYSSTYIGGSSSTSKTAMNAYITWALSTVCPDDSRLSKSVNYLKNLNYSKEDNYTLALIANVFANVNESTTDIIKILMDNVTVVDDGAYIGSRIYDYYGSYGRYQDVQTTALTSLALSKLNKENKNNAEFINYIIAKKSQGGTWGTTQSTILALKAINEFSATSDVSEQTITINLNGKNSSIDIKDEFLDVYEVEFDNISKENKLEIGMKKGKIIYEVVEKYAMDYSNIKSNEDIELNYTMTNTTNVNGEITQTIIVKPNKNVENGLLKINIPQGASVIEDTLLKLKYDGLIEKYEYNYNSINIYFRNMNRESSYIIDVKYRALYPEEITGGAIRFYDYYNPDVEAISGPSRLTVN